MIVEALARFLVAIHKEQPITGNVLALGKQTIKLSINKLIEIFKENSCEINPNLDLNNLKKDISSRFRETDSMDDSTFFKFFSDLNYQTLDVTDYEGASIIHDLNNPIPTELEGQFDFIIDGGTFDHLFDLKNCFENVVKLMKPDGRIFQWNAASNYSNAGYLSFSADYFYDYYILNKFTKCQTYFAQSHCMSAPNWYITEFVPDASAQRYPEFKRTSFYSMVIVVATKGKDSTYNVAPIQLQYRDKTIQKNYEEVVRNMQKNTSRLKLKSLSYRKAQLPRRYKAKLFFEPKSDSKIYRKIGWL